MTVFQGAVDATFGAFGIDAFYMPAGGEAVSVRVIARRPDTVVGFGETRIHAETATFELRAGEVASPRPGDQLTVGDGTSLSRASRSGAIPTGSCGLWMLESLKACDQRGVSARIVEGVRCPIAFLPSLQVLRRLPATSRPNGCCWPS